MPRIVVQLSAKEARALKARTGKRTVKAALQEWIERASTERSVAELRAALKESRKEEVAGKGRRFKSGREAMRWLES